VAKEWLNRSEVHHWSRRHANSKAANDTTKQRSSTWIYRDDLPLSVNLRQFNFVRTDESATNQVDGVSREEVFGEQEFTWSTFEASKVNAAALKGHAPLSETPNFSNRDKGISSLNANNGANNGRVGIGTEASNEVLDATDPVTVAIEDWTAKKRGKVKNLLHRESSRPPKFTLVSEVRKPGKSIPAAAHVHELPPSTRFWRFVEQPATPA
jgi:hypothetical protein